MPRLPDCAFGGVGTCLYAVCKTQQAVSKQTISCGGSIITEPSTMQRAFMTGDGLTDHSTAATIRPESTQIRSTPQAEHSSCCVCVLESRVLITWQSTVSAQLPSSCLCGVQQPDAAWVCVYNPLQVEGHIQSIEGSKAGDAHNQCQHPEICSAPRYTTRVT